jgi:Ca2+-binding RTX toxin-like protein
MSLPQVALAHGSVVTNKSTAYVDAHVAAAALAMLLASSGWPLGSRVGSLTTPARPAGPRARPECTIVGTAGDDDLRGTQHDDVICGRGGDDWVLGEEGNDTLFLGRGDDSGGGGPGDDVIRGGAGKDYGEGGYGNDRIYVGRGDKDEVIDYHGMDVVSGGPGDDYCLNVRDGHGGDLIRGGPGKDGFYIDDGDRVFSAEVTSKPGSYIRCG